MKFRNIYISNYKLLTSLLIGFTSLSSASFFLYSKVINFIKKGDISDTDNIYQVMELNLYLKLVEPIVFLLVIYLVLKFINNNNLYFLSLLITILSTGIFIGIQYLTFKELYILEITKTTTSFFVLIFTWIVLIQTQKDKIKALSTGFLSFLITKDFFNFIQVYINENTFELLSFILSICFAGFISILFSYILKISFMLLRIKNN